MKIDFEGKLGKTCVDDKARLKAHGQERSKKLRARLTALHAADNLEQLRHSPGYFHELKADRKGEFACSLDGPYRLIFRPVLQAGVVPNNDWSHITHVLITEITDYHG